MKGGARPGAGRPAVSEEEKYKLRSFKCTDNEWQQIKNNAKKAGKTTSEYIRIKTLS